MKKGFLSTAHPTTQLLFAGLVLIASWIIFQLFAMATGMFIFDVSIDGMLNIYNAFNDPVMIDFLKYVQALTSIGMFIAAAIFAAYFIDGDWQEFLNLKRSPGIYLSILSVLFITIILPFTNFLSYINMNIQFPYFLSGVEDFFRSKETQMTEIMESFLKPSGSWGLLINLVVIALIPAIGEELTFRGILQKILSRWFGNTHWAIFLTAFLFSAMHIQFLSFLPRFFLGLVLGYLFFWSNSIWLTILVHFVNNAVAVIFYNFYYGGQAGDFLEKAGTPGNYLFLAFSGLAIGITLLAIIYRKCKSDNIFN